MAVRVEASSWSRCVDEVCVWRTPADGCVRHCCALEQSIPEFRSGDLTTSSLVRTARQEVLEAYTFDPDEEPE